MEALEGQKASMEDRQGGSCSGSLSLEGFGMGARGDDGDFSSPSLGFNADQRLKDGPESL